MKKILSLSLVFVLVLSAFVLASCKGTNDKDAQNTAPPHSAASETAAPTETPTAAPETEAPTADPNPRPDPVTVEWLAGEMQRRYYVGCMNLELMDGNADSSLYKKLFDAVATVSGVQNPHKARIRRMASSFDIDLDIEVDPSLSVYEAHELSEQVESAIRREIPEIDRKSTRLNSSHRL